MFKLDKKIIIGILLILILFILFFVSLKIGDVNISIIDFIFNKLSKKNRIILENLRLTRTLGGIVAGGILGLSGCILQNILRNPLASPFTIGVSQGAAFGAAFAIIFLKSNFILLSAFGGSLITIFILFLISLLPDIKSESLILAGVAISSFFTAATMFLKYFANDIQVASAVFWTFGDLSKSDFHNISLMTIVFFISFLFFFKNSWNYNAFLWGEDIAQTLGVNIKIFIICSLIFSSFICSITIAYLGIIGFVGFIAPHIIRMLIGNDYRYLIPYSAINGANILLFADILSRTILKPIIIPVGIITSFLGVPLFLYILLRKRNVRS